MVDVATNSERSQHKIWVKRVDTFCNPVLDSPQAVDGSVQGFPEDRDIRVIQRLSVSVFAVQRFRQVEPFRACPHDAKCPFVLDLPLLHGVVVGVAATCVESLRRFGDGSDRSTVENGHHDNIDAE
jgi:hypothetical protein